MTDEQLARSWAGWEATAFIDDLEELDIGEVDEPAFREQLVAMLMRIALDRTQLPPVHQSSEGEPK